MPKPDPSPGVQQKHTHTVGAKFRVVFPLTDGYDPLYKCNVKAFRHSEIEWQRVAGRQERQKGHSPLPIFPLQVLFTVGPESKTVLR